MPGLCNRTDVERSKRLSHPRSGNDRATTNGENRQCRVRSPCGGTLIAPAVGYRITAGDVAVFYVSDLVSIHERRDALSHIQLYIRYGASIIRPILRHRGKVLIGHASIRDQLDWCREESTERIVITHCGSQIVNADARAANARVRVLGRERSLHVRIAYDGMTLMLATTQNA